MVGAKVQGIPVESTSFATASPMLSIRSGFIVDPRPILWGKIVAPITLLCPWTASVPHRIGIRTPLTTGDAL